MECQDREGCSLQAERHHISMGLWLKRGQEELERWCGIPENERMLVFGEHAEKRMVERALSSDTITTVVEFGEVIERYSKGHTLEILILGYMPVGGKRWRPIHVKLAKHRAAPAEMWVKTAYDPSTRPWQWSRDYRQRICWCGGGDED